MFSRPSGTLPAVVLALAAGGAALLILAALVLTQAIDLAGNPGLPGLALALAVALGGFALVHAYQLLRQHFTALERLRGTIVTLAGDRTARVPVIKPEAADPETRRLHDALGDLEARHAREQAAPDRRLRAVLASISEAMVVITEEGQVSLVNHAAKQLLGAERVACGTSVYAAISRTTVLDAVGRARRAGRPVDAMIGTLEEFQLTAKVASLADHGGAVLTFPAGEVAFRAELEVDLALHDQPPEPPPINDDTPLASLPVLVMDSETTGLDIARDRIVSIGAVRLAGGRVYRSTSFDRLVNPGVAIPPRSTAIHGITDAMVADAAVFPKVFEQLQPHLADSVIVGHHISFDLRMLQRECELAALPWRDPPFLDTLLLAAALDSDLTELTLDALAAYLGVSLHGRHTALGDSLVTAEVFGRLLPRLHDRGVDTFGQAVAFSRRATAFLKAQERAGW